MDRYYKELKNVSNLSRKLGSAASVSADFRILSSLIVSQCSFIQGLIQHVIFVTHGPELLSAKNTIQKFPNPKARVDFLCAFEFGFEDHVVKKVFEYSRDIFKKIYEIRNVLSHEIWSSSDEYPGAVLFTSLDEDARLLMASGRMLHKEDVTPQEIYDATMRYIGKVKIVTRDHLIFAAKDIDICAWSLMNISNLIDEKDELKREQIRKSFFRFGGTSHLFDSDLSVSEDVEFSASKERKVYGKGDPG